MKQALALILAGSTFGLASEAMAGGSVPAVHRFVFEGPGAQGDGSERALRVSDDGDEDGGGWLWRGNGGGSGSGEGNGGGSSDDCNSDDPACMAGNAAPAGTVAPPKNGLFTDGTAPRAVTN